MILKHATEAELEASIEKSQKDFYNGEYCYKALNFIKKTMPDEKNAHLITYIPSQGEYFCTVFIPPDKVIELDLPYADEIQAELSGTYGFSEYIKKFNIRGPERRYMYKILFMYLKKRKQERIDFLGKCSTCSKVKEMNDKK